MLKLVGNHDSEVCGQDQAEEAPLLSTQGSTGNELHLRNFVDTRFIAAMVTETTISSILSAFESVCSQIGEIDSNFANLQATDPPTIHNGNI
jgi:hypothetical protein